MYTLCMEYVIHHMEVVDSTNSVLKELAQSGEPEGYVLVADRQTAGRGRLGRSFYSPAGSGLYFSILLRPKKSVTPAALTCLSAVAVAETILSYGKPCSIKWVNDIYCHQKKACGILTEGAFLPDGTLSYAIVGIGINLSLPDTVPEELQSVLTAVFEEPTDPAFRDEFLSRLMDRFSAHYDRLPEIDFWETYNRLQNCRGRKISFLQDGIRKTGTAESIDRCFRLLVRTEEGLVALERGEVVFI